MGTHTHTHTHTRIQHAIHTQAAAVQAQQQPLLGLAAGLRRRLEGLGALSSSDNMRVFSGYSTGLVDMMPKQWALGGKQGCVFVCVCNLKGVRGKRHVHASGHEYARLHAEAMGA